MSDASTERSPGLPTAGGFTRPEWDEYFMLLAKLAAIRSTCLSRPAGAVIVVDQQVLATGYNGSMPGVAHCTDEGVCFRRSFRASEQDKYDLCRAIHAEANAIAQAARRGVSIEGGTVYTTLAPCFVCTKLMASARIRRVVYEHEYESPDRERDAMWRQAMVEAGIECQQLSLTSETIERARRLISTTTSLRRPLSETGEPMEDGS